MSHSKKIILIGGPTASGKSALALGLARKQNGVIINSDALQIYAGLPILTAQPTRAEQKEIPHKLYGVIEPSESSSAGLWLQMVTQTIEETVSAGHTPILVGGTGLYFRALLDGLSDIPAIPETVRAEIQHLYENQGEVEFRKLLESLDPVSAARIARNDRQRLIRAYEVVKHTGKTLGEWHAKGSENGDRGRLENVEFETHALLPPREELYAACDCRFTAMIEQGAVEEVEKFLQRGLDPSLPAMKTIGVREIGAYLKGDWTLNETISKAQQMTRNYAKRQMTWFRNQGFGASA